MHRLVLKISFLFFLSALPLTCPEVHAASPDKPPVFPDSDWVFLDNGHVRLGAKKSSGACIGYLSLSRTNRNLLNHFDHGRLVQQSYYGDRDGTVWGAQPWRWNPVQGGDYKGGPARVLDLKATATTLYAKTLPRHWSGCVDLPEVRMEQWITLTGKLTHVHFKMTYSGTNHYSPQAQEIPAFFAEPELDTLILYDGEEPWKQGALSRSRPGWPNESRRMTEHWAAYVGTNDFGVGAFVPIATELTCYRYGRGGSKDGACSYFAPVTHFAITPGFVFEYDLYLAVGQTDEIREAFSAIRASVERGGHK